ncbi:MAG: hypothetical protein WC488_02640 [Candidatus Micrarchaeia archaeon]
MRRPGLAIVLLLAISLSGCIVDKDVSALANEKVLSAGARDLDLDNMTDFKTYTFRPITISAESNISMQKFATAAQTQTLLTVKKVNQLSDPDVSALETRIFEFDLDRKQKESECSQALGLHKGGSCTGARDCAALCTASQCKKYEYSSDLVGYWIYRYSEDTKANDQDMELIRQMLITIAHSGESDREILMGKISALMDRTIEINANPLLSENMFAVCKPIDYDNEKLAGMLATLGDYERAPKAYSYAVNLKTTTQSHEYIELNVSDSLPKAALPTLSDMVVPQEGGKYTFTSNTVGWPLVKSSVYSEYMLGYGFKTSQGMREDIFDNWATPKVTLRVISFTNNWLVAGIMALSKWIYSVSKGLGYYTALAFVVSFWAIAASAAWLLGKVIFAAVNAVVSRCGFRDSAVRILGRANIYWKEYAVAAVLALAIGYALRLGAAPVMEDVLNLPDITRHLAESIPGTLSMVSIFFAIYLVYSVVEDRVKGALAGRAYYENILDVSPKANELRMRKLREKIEELEARVKGAGKLDVGDERGVLISVPLDRMETLMKKPGSERAAKELIELYITRAEAAIVKVDEKARVFSHYGKEWSKEISEKLAEKDEVPFSALSDIPQEWRAPAASRFAIENEDEGLVVDAAGIKRSESSPQGKADSALRKLVSKGGALGGVVFNKDRVLAVHSDSGNRSIEAILSWKISNYGKALAQKVHNSDFTAISITGEKHAAIIVRGQENDGVVFAKKEGAQELAAELEAKLGKI